MKSSFFSYDELKKTCIKLDDFSVQNPDVGIVHGLDLIYLIEQFKKGNVKLSNADFAKNFNHIVNDLYNTNGFIYIQDLDVHTLRLNIAEENDIWEEEYAIDKRLLTKHISTRFSMGIATLKNNDQVWWDGEVFDEMLGYYCNIEQVEL